MKVMLAVDGSSHSLDAVRCLIDQVARYREPPEIELVTVHRPVPMLPGMDTVVSKADLGRYYQDEGAQALAEASKLLDRSRVPYRSQILVGDPGDVILKRAKEERFDLICLGTRAKWIGSTATKVIHQSEVPVLVVK
jgi:nucleotide-binding universal stress UspA family protein